MIQLLGLIIALIVGFLIPIIIAIGSVYFLFCDLVGVPFVGTKKQFLDEIFKEIKLKRKQTLVELGSGDGRVLIYASKKFGLKSIGYEINLILVCLSRILIYLSHAKTAKVLNKSFYNANIQNADIIFLFLMTKTIKKIFPKLEKEVKKGAIIISHGFKIPGFEKNQVKVIKRDPFSTYFYRI